MHRYICVIINLWARIAWDLNVITVKMILVARNVTRYVNINDNEDLLAEIFIVTAAVLLYPVMIIIVVCFRKNHISLR